jgi:hypothetical protein
MHEADTLTRNWYNSLCFNSTVISEVVLDYILDIYTPIILQFLTNCETQLSQPFESLVHTVIPEKRPRDATDTRPVTIYKVTSNDQSDPASLHTFFDMPGGH